MSGTISIEDVLCPGPCSSIRSFIASANGWRGGILPRCIKVHVSAWWRGGLVLQRLRHFELIVRLFLSQTTRSQWPHERHRLRRRWLAPDEPAIFPMIGEGLLAICVGLSLAPALFSLAMLMAYSITLGIAYSMLVHSPANVEHGLC